MIKVSILYPNAEGKTFDMDYYRDTHIPMTERLLEGALRGVTVEQGVSGGRPGSNPPFIAAGHLLFDSLESFYEAFRPHAEALMDDIPNYTDIEPIVQISEIQVSEIQIGEIKSSR